MEKTLKDEIQGILDNSKEFFCAYKGLSPMLFAICKGQKRAILLDFDLAKNKKAFVSKITDLIETGELTEYVLAIEAWMLREDASLGVQESLRECVSISKHPNRREILMVQYCSPTEEIIFINEIKRETGEHSVLDKATCGEWERLDQSKECLGSVGLMQSLFKKGRAGWN